MQPWKIELFSGLQDSSPPQPWGCHLFQVTCPQISFIIFRVPTDSALEKKYRKNREICGTLWNAFARSRQITSTGSPLSSRKVTISCLQQIRYRISFSSEPILLIREEVCSNYIRKVIYMVYNLLEYFSKWAQYNGILCLFFYLLLWNFS